MDDPAASPAEIEQSLVYLRGLNARLGGSRALVKHLEAWSREPGGWPADRPAALLDIATGSADIPIATLRWADRRGVQLQVTAIDRHPVTLDAARRYVASAGFADRITLVESDALRLMDLYQPGSFDFVHAGLFLHHLPDVQALTVLRIMDRLVRPGGGLVWNDLVRSRVCLGLAWAATRQAPLVVRHDAWVSIEAGFTRREVLDARRRLDLGYTRYRRSPLLYRFTLAGRKPGSL
jgi:ubiquinone/menaquinone biosynthesis C-methylase UbiE